MTREQKYDAVNQCKSLEELAAVIESFTDENGMIQGRTKPFVADLQVRACKIYDQLYRGGYPNTLTREFGIRQQAMYIIFTYGN